MGLAHIDSGLDDDQIQSLVHQLRHEYTENGGGPAAEHTQQAWDRFRSTTATRITAHPGLRPQRRAGLLRRITQADATPPADMAYAAQHIRDRAIRAARLMEDHLATESARIGVPDHDVVATYEQGRRGAPTGRQARATDEDRRRWPGLPLDPRTRHGLAAVMARSDNPAGRRELIPAHEAVRAEHTTVVQGVGYHPDSGRLEILTPDHSVLTYRQVPPALVEQLRTADDPDLAFQQRIQGRPEFQYRDAVQAAAAGVRRRCPDCGQFTGATHNCMGRRGGILDSAMGSVTPLGPIPRRTIDLPGLGEGYTAPLDAVTARLETVRGDGVEFPVLHPADAAEPGARVTGDLTAVLDPDDHVSVSAARLACDCDGYAAGQGCPHTRAVATALRNQLAQQLTTSRAHAAAATAAAITSTPTGGATTQPVTDTLLTEAPNQSTFSYAADSGRFADDVRVALGRPDGQQVPWIDGSDQTPVMYGYGSDREFGVELEFDLTPDAHQGQLPIDQRVNHAYRGGHYGSALAVGRVARALHEAEFTRGDRQAGYHTGARSGYQRSLRGGWTYESDCSVAGGELVSPILSNTPETWRRLNEACTIITQYGGIPSSGTGSHVTVSAPEQAGRAVRLSRFLSLMHHHQQDLHLMAAAGHQRGTGYAQPLPTPPDQGYTSITHARSLGRYRFANIGHVTTSRHDPGAASSRVEFRLWDGSLEPGRIQAQIKMSTAMLDYTARNRGLTFPADQRAGEATINPDNNDFANDTHQVRTLIDNLFRRDADRQQAAALWAAGLHARGYLRTHSI